MGWTPTNLTELTPELDVIFHIPGLYTTLNNHKHRNAYYNLNVCVNGLRYRPLPQNFELYILGFWSEVFDEEWFYKSYLNNPHAQFLILSDRAANDLIKLPRVTWIRMLHWKFFLPAGQTNSIDWAKRRYKISSLSGRVTEFRYFISAKLLNRPDVLMRWNRSYQKDDSIDYIFATTGYAARDSLLSMSHQFNKPINSEIYINDPIESLGKSLTNPAYSESLINCINETKDVSWVESVGICPGPYITEKTWKPLINGNALIFVGQSKISSTLKELGFKFDYPWSNNYDLVTGDLDRLERILMLIDEILSLSADCIIDGIRGSAEFNQRLVYSDEIKNTIDSINQQALFQLNHYFKTNV